MVGPENSAAATPWPWPWPCPGPHLCLGFAGGALLSSCAKNQFWFLSLPTLGEGKTLPGKLRTLSVPGMGLTLQTSSARGTDELYRAGKVILENWELSAC